MIKRIINKFKKPIENGILKTSEYRRISLIDRFIPGKTDFLCKEFRFVDSVSFLGSYEEIFLDEIYKFNVASDNPVIIDCGANIGLASIYFKSMYPKAEVHAYEADPEISKVMKWNCHSLGLEVACHCAAISNEGGKIMKFWAEGGHSGMLTKEEGESVIEVETVRLKTILESHNRIDFLKIDIEGHENVVIEDVADSLQGVENMFIEYHSFLGEPQELQDILNIITKAGFRYYIKEAAAKQQPFLKRELFLNMDLLVNIFCYRK